MSLRIALIAVMMLLTVTGVVMAEFTTPSLDQWGSMVQRVFPREHPAMARDASGTWVAPTSIVLVNGAPVGLHTMQPNTTMTVAAGEEMILHPAYDGRTAKVYEVYTVSPPALRTAEVYEVYRVSPPLRTAEVYEVYTVSPPAPALIISQRSYGRVTEIAANGDVEIRTEGGRALAMTLSPDAVRAVQQGSDVSIDTTFAPTNGSVR